VKSDSKITKDADFELNLPQEFSLKLYSKCKHELIKKKILNDIFEIPSDSLKYELGHRKLLNQVFANNAKGCLEDFAEKPNKPIVSFKKMQVKSLFYCLAGSIAACITFVYLGLMFMNQNNGLSNDVLEEQRLTDNKPNSSLHFERFTTSDVNIHIIKSKALFSSHSFEVLKTAKLQDSNNLRFHKFVMQKISNDLQILDDEKMLMCRVDDKAVVFVGYPGKQKILLLSNNLSVK